MGSLLKYHADGRKIDAVPAEHMVKLPGENILHSYPFGKLLLATFGSLNCLVDCTILK